MIISSGRNLIDMTTEITRSRFESEAKRLRPILLRVAITIIGNEEDAADIVQETLLKLWFFRSRLESYSCLDAPARVIVRNLSLNFVRDRKSIILVPDNFPDIVNEEIDKELSDELLSAITTLPSTEQAVLRLKHIDGMETEEIAQLINSSTGAVRTALSRARKKIKELYNRHSKI